MSRDVPDDAYFESDCPTHGRTTFVDLMGDDVCLQCQTPPTAAPAPEGRTGDELARKVRAFESMYGWWNDDDSLHTCGICNEEGEHSPPCPVNALPDGIPPLHKHGLTQVWCDLCGDLPREVDTETGAALARAGSPEGGQ